jgi:flavin reductase (DIM6/NTAB) family NADH-FMN oxidoreductase RutF
MDIARAVADIPSGLFVTSVKDSKSVTIAGFLASWVQQVSFKPLRVAIAIRPTRNVYDDIANGAIFSLGVVGEEVREFKKYFWSGYGEDENPYEQLEWYESESGGVVLRDAKSTIVLKKHELVEAGDHHLIIADVLESIEQQPEVESYVHRRRDGLSY